MPRPIKCRRVNFLPQARYFKPAGIQLDKLEEVCLSFEEIEAIRLKDVEGLEQGQAAQRMNVSRPTFQRVLASARRKVGESLIQGKAIRIEGGIFEIPPCRFKCRQGHEWDVPFEKVTAMPSPTCPVCHTTEIACTHQSGQNCENRGRIKCCQLESLLETTFKPIAPSDFG